MFAWNTRVACHDRDVVCSQVALTSISWKLQCDMYVLQFYSNLFSTVLAQLRSTLRCRCVDASTSTPPHLCKFTSSHAHIRRSTSPPHHTHTSAHLYHICTSTLSLLHISFFLHICSLASVHLHLRTLTSTDLPLHLHTSTHLYRTCTSTLSLLHVHPLFLYIFSTALDNHMSRSRANRRLVVFRYQAAPQAGWLQPTQAPPANQGACEPGWRKPACKSQAFSPATVSHFQAEAMLLLRRICVLYLVMSQASVSSQIVEVKLPEVLTQQMPLTAVWHHPVGRVGEL